MAHYAKFIAALAAALAVTGTCLADGHITAAEWVAIAVAFVGALAVRQVTNAPAEEQHDAV
jgi:hypothetical protein